MDRPAVEAVAKDWAHALAASDTSLAWLRDAELTAYPAFLVDALTKEGDDYKAGAVPIKLQTPSAPTDDAFGRIHAAVVGDRSLGGRVKHAYYEHPTADGGAGILVIIPL